MNPIMRIHHNPRSGRPLLFEYYSGWPASGLVLINLRLVSSVTPIPVSGGGIEVLLTDGTKHVLMNNYGDAEGHWRRDAEKFMQACEQWVEPSKDPKEAA